MKTAAIIAEYNPFHEGHRYQLAQTCKQTGADFFLVIMSGDFVQRGAPAFADKYLRTRLALLGGAHVVIELPALYATSSAEFFAQGAVSLLEHLHVADILSFGSESGILSPFTFCAELLTQRAPQVQSLTHTYLKAGLSYPAARERAVSELFASDSAPCNISPESISGLFSSPNNILGLEYCKALLAAKSQIRPFTLKREGMGYHDTLSAASRSGYLSASALRELLAGDPSSGLGHMSEVSCAVLRDALSLYPFVSENAFSQMLHYKLLSQGEEGFCQYLDCSPALSHKIRKNLPLFESFTGFCHLLKSRELTYARISRVLTHILLNIKTPEAFRKPFPERTLPVPYARLLGFRRSAAPLLSAISKNSAIPLISKLADARRLLDDQAFTLLGQDIFCANIYEAARPKAIGAAQQNEWKRSPVVIDDSSSDSSDFSCPK